MIVTHQGNTSYRATSAKFPVRHLCSYLADWSGFPPREQDKAAGRIVTSLKGGCASGPASLRIDGAEIRLEEANAAAFLEQVWGAVGQSLAASIDGRAAIVPIPDSSARIDEAPDYRTLRYAQHIAAHSRGKLVVMDSLRWRRGAVAGYRAKNLRLPEERYDSLVVTRRPRLPVILFDDTITSGSSLVAAYWHLQDVGNAPVGALVVARRTLTPRADMLAGEEREMDIPARAGLRLAEDGGFMPLPESPATHACQPNR